MSALWKATLAAALDLLTREDGGVASHRTKEMTGDVLFHFMNTAHELGYRLEHHKNVGHKHISAVVRHWYYENHNAPVTIVNDLSRLRVFYKQNGKPDLVKKAPAYFPELDKALFKIETAAQESKGITANAVDLTELINRAYKKDRRLGNMLRMELAFGLRGEEVMHCKPWQADHGHFLRVFEGEAKGGKSRNIPIESQVQRDVLNQIKLETPKTKGLAWEHTYYGKPTNLEKNMKRYENSTYRLGFNRKKMGLTPHSLRAQFSENEALRLAFIPATLGGTSSPLPADEVKLRRVKVSLSLGHNRDSITAAYYGPLIRSHDVDDRAEFKAALLEAVAVLNSSSKEQTIQQDRVDDVVTLTGLVLKEDGIALLPTHAYQLWQMHSSRFAVEWVPLESGIRQSLQVAARQIVINSAR